MNQKIISCISSLFLSCTTAPIQPYSPPSPQEQQSLALNNIDQQFNAICQTYTVNDKEIHCTLPKEPYYIHYRWDEIKTTYCHGNRLILDTILDTKTTPTPNLETCNILSSEVNTYLRLVGKK